MINQSLDTASALAMMALKRRLKDGQEASEVPDYTRPVEDEVAKGAGGEGARKS